MAPSPPELIEEMVEEVLLRFPPNDPASLVRAALVCKLWCRLVSGTAFRRRFREFHRGAAPLLGVLYTTGRVGDWHKHKQVRDNDDTPSWADDDTARSTKRARILREPTARFARTTSYRPVHTADGRRNGLRAIDAHHGRVLLCRHSDDPWCPTLALSVWDPITDEQLDLPEAPLHTLGYSAAVSCAAAAGGNCCDHLDCHQGPFLVVAIDVQTHAIIFSVYSSEAGAWSDLTILEHSPGSLGIMKHTPGVLVGSALYFLVHFSNEIVEFDLATQQVCTADLPSAFRGLSEQGSIVLLTGDDGELGFVAYTEYQQLELWSMEAGRDASFVLTRVIDLHKVLPSGALVNNSFKVNGFADGGASRSRFLFMRTSNGLYSIEINSSQVTKVANCCGDDDVVPYISFLTPTSRIQLVQDYNSGSTGDDDAMVEDDGLQKIVQQRRPRTKNPRFYGPEWANK